MSYRNYGVTPGRVVDKNGHGDFETITLALAAASSGDTIYVNPGTYTENFTLPAGITLSALPGSEDTPTVTIIGKVSMSAAGTSTVSSCRIQTNNDYCVSILGSGGANIVLDSCYINCTNHTAIQQGDSSPSSSIKLYNCEGNVGTTGIAFYVLGNNSYILIDTSLITNTGGSTTYSNVSTGEVGFYNSYIEFPVSQTQQTVISSLNTYFNCASINTCPVLLTNFGSAGSVGYFYNCTIEGGTASALSVGTNDLAYVYNCLINSSNTNAITGTGTLYYGGVTFSGSSTINTSTQNPVALTVPQGGTGLTSPGTTGNVLTSNGTIWTSAPPSSGGFSSVNIQTFTTGGTYTPTSGMAYCIIECIGGGGGGGGITGGSGYCSVGGGGGGGGYSRLFSSAATIGASQSVTVGAAGTAGVAGGASPGGTGGTSSVGSLLSATGGVGGNGCNTFGDTVIEPGGLGGAGASGTFNSTGSPGGAGFGVNPSLGTPFAMGGVGGSSYFGGGGISPTAGNGADIAGNAGTAYGGGGSGALQASNASPGTNQAGGAGYAGVVIITEYI